MDGTNTISNVLSASGISAEMVSAGTGLPLEPVKDLFCNEVGYQTPKIETRAAIVQDEAILLVQEDDGRWTLPGGWCDIGFSLAENTVKEVWEETGLEAEAMRVIAILDQQKNNVPVCIHHVYKVFVQCQALGGQFRPNTETIDSGYFRIDELPTLCPGKANEAQIRMCIEASRADRWTTLFD